MAERLLSFGEKFYVAEEGEVGANEDTGGIN